MDLEELLDPEGEHGSRVQTCTNKEIVEALQAMNVDAEATDREDQGADVRVVSRKLSRPRILSDALLLTVQPSGLVPSKLR